MGRRDPDEQPRRSAERRFGAVRTGQTLTAQLRSERDHFVRNLLHPNAAEGLKAFLDKRTPQYR